MDLYKWLNIRRCYVIQQFDITYNVLHLPKFKYNLLLVHNLLRDEQIIVIFNANCCYLQEKRNKTLIAIGWQEGGLYKLDGSSFDKKLTNMSFL